MFEYMAKIKVKSPEHSKELQGFLFSLGYMWVSNGKSFLNLDATYLFIKKDGTLGWDSTEDFFRRQSVPEWSLDDLRRQVREKFLRLPLKVRVSSDEEGREVLEALFSLGAIWEVEYGVKNPSDSPFFYVRKTGYLTYGKDEHDFLRKEFYDVEAEELLIKAGRLKTLPNVKKENEVENSEIKLPPVPSLVNEDDWKKAFEDYGKAAVLLNQSREGCAPTKNTSPFNLEKMKVGDKVLFKGEEVVWICKSSRDQENRNIVESSKGLEYAEDSELLCFFELETRYVNMYENGSIFIHETEEQASEAGTLGGKKRGVTAWPIQLPKI